jgi:hypothetical protein
MSGKKGMKWRQGGAVVRRLDPKVTPEKDKKPKKRPPAKLGAGGDRDPVVPKCEAATNLCNGLAPRRLTGPRTGSPTFWCCLSCESYLRRNGMLVREAKE